MTSNSLFTKFLPLATLAMMAGTLVGCSTVKSISPFGSNVPYAQDIQPNMPKPAVSEIPAFKPKPPAPPAPKPEPPAAETPAPAPAAPEPAAPAPVAPSPAPTSTPTPPPSQSSATPANVPKVAEAQAPSQPAAAPQPGKPAASEKTVESSDDTQATSESGKRATPTIPDADRQFKDDGTYPNLAQVPARPVNMPTFAEAKALEKSLVADREKAKNASPASPDAPSVDSTPVPVAKLAKPDAATPVVTATAERTEDRSPCLSEKPVDGQPTATIRFEPGSAAMTSANLALLSEALPTIRAAKGTIRIFGHGDTETDAATGPGRFDLAAARAGAVAQAVAGYGIPVPRIAVGVACSDAAFAGASVQLYAES